MSYEAWRATFQSSEQAARAAYQELQAARAQSGQGAEPVAVIDRSGVIQPMRGAEGLAEGDKLYTHPQPTQKGSVPDVGAMADVLGEWVRNTTGTALTHVTLVDMVRVMLATTAPQPGSDGNKRHWYALSYRGRDRESGYTADAVTYTGYPKNALTLARIQAAKADAGVDDKAVLVCATYLGHMTKEEFTTQQEAPTMSDLPLHRTMQDDEIDRLKARVAELEADNAHQRERRNAARDCIQKMKAESLRKQADAAEEAIVCALRTVGNVDPFEVNIYKFANDYAQRLRQQADEAERPQSPQEGSGYE